jgi:hypothetical protein
MSEASGPSIADVTVSDSDTEEPAAVAAATEYEQFGYERVSIASSEQYRAASVRAWLPEKKVMQCR